MNTILKGDTFELNSYNLIVNAIEKDRLGISPKYARVFQKKGYHSNIRKKDIIFDLSIEIWPPGAERYSLLFLIECKDYSNKNVPVGDVESFLYKVRQINNSQGNDARGAKGVFISNNSYQEGAVEIAKETGLMLIEVNSSNELIIKLHRAERKNVENELLEQEKEIETFLFNVFDLNKVQGLKKYSKKGIEAISNKLINSVDETVLQGALRTPLDKIFKFLSQEHDLKFDFEWTALTPTNKPVLGYFDVSNNQIKIEKTLFNTERFSFLVAHEIGHFILHRNLQINQQAYDNFNDSEYDFVTNKYLLNNFKNWIEWQANEFASNLIMPSSSFFNRLVHIQKHLGINRRGYIYLDDQPVNRRDFGDITTYLSTFFMTTYTSVIYRLESLELITYNRKADSYKDELRNFYKNLQDDF